MTTHITFKAHLLYCFLTAISSIEVLTDSLCECRWVKNSQKSVKKNFQSDIQSELVELSLPFTSLFLRSTEGTEFNRALQSSQD